MAEPELCPFCEIVEGRAPATFVAQGYRQSGMVPGVIAFVPLAPVTPGHVLFVPSEHVVDAAESPPLTAAVFGRAAAYAQVCGEPFNLITSAGAEATQTVQHLHVHYVPRAAGDGLPLPWTSQQAAPVVDAAAVVALLESRYQEAINAVVSAPAGIERDADVFERNPDVDRWRGHAEAARSAAEAVRQLAGMPPVAMTSREWREANGVSSG